MLTSQREESREPGGCEGWTLGEGLLEGGLVWGGSQRSGRLGPWRLHWQQGLLPQALTGTFITHSCAVLGPTDCGKPIWLQEVSSRGHSPPRPHTLLHLLIPTSCSRQEGQAAQYSARGLARVSNFWAELEKSEKLSEAETFKVEPLGSPGSTRQGTPSKTHAHREPEATLEPSGAEDQELRLWSPGVHPVLPGRTRGGYTSSPC